MSNAEICFIGNSHLVCLKEALSEPEPTDQGWGQVNYFYAPGFALKDFKIVDGHIAATSSYAKQLLAARNGHTTLPIAQQSMFAIVGLQLGLHICTHIWPKYRLWQFQAPGTALVSKEAMAAAIAGAIRNTLAFKIARELRSETRSPIALITQPSPVEAILSVSSAPAVGESEYRRVRRLRGLRSMARWRPLQGEPDAGAEMNRLFVEALHRVAKAEGLIAVEQPSNTLANVLTKSLYRRDDRPNDVVHTNKQYGREVLGRLQSLSQIQ